jgi:hypothetical protein
VIVLIENTGLVTASSTKKEGNKFTVIYVA